MTSVPNKEVTFFKANEAYLEIGPMSMAIKASGKKEFTEKEFNILAESLRAHLACISKELVTLKQPWPTLDFNQLSFYGESLYNAVKGTGDKQLTLMAGIAGLMSMLAMETLKELGATKAFINNGGDIELLLPIDESFNVGIIPSLKMKAISQVVKVTQREPIQGIATSGLGGRSFTLGIADAVTVFSKNAITADACAKVIANKSLIVSNEIIRTKAKHIDANSDIGELDVVVKVGHLSQTEISRSLSQIYKEAENQFHKGNLVKMIAFVQGQKVSYSPIKKAESMEVG